MNTLLPDEYINAKEAASLLGIHQASIRNWVRHGYLNPVNSTGSIKFRKNDIEQLKEKIASGRIERLNKRANKSKALKTFIPAEYLSDPGDEKKIEVLSAYIANNKLEPSAALFYLMLNILNKNKVILFTHTGNPCSFIIETDNIFLKQDLQEWLDSLDKTILNDIYSKLLYADIPEGEDLAGLVYQSVLPEGKKSKSGSYYTPKNIINSIIADHLKPGIKILDPCCGTGSFLLCAASHSDDPLSITGFDIDILAVRIARINLMMKFSKRHFNPLIFCFNTLRGLPEEFNNSFDLIISNPPWGMHLSGKEFELLRKKYPEIKSGESFSYFIRKAYDLLKWGGMISFLLPEAILNVRTHRDIRKFIIDKMNISSVYLYGRMFRNVFSKVIRLDISREVFNPETGNRIKIVQDTVTAFSSQSSLHESPDYIFSFHMDEYSDAIFNKVYSHEYTTLKGQAEWALGIVTGDNRKFLAKSKLEGYEEVYTGKEVAKYKLKEPSNYIKFSPEKFQQCAPAEKYRAEEKLIYKFISGSLVFAYDNGQRLTLNSANILIPVIRDYPVKTILALFNSALYRFIYRRKFNSIKVLRSHLEALPLPVFSREIHQKISQYVELILNGEKKESELDQLIFSLLGLTHEEIKYVSSFEK